MATIRIQMSKKITHSEMTISAVNTALYAYLLNFNAVQINVLANNDDVTVIVQLPRVPKEHIVSTLVRRHLIDAGVAVSTVNVL